MGFASLWVLTQLAWTWPHGAAAESLSKRFVPPAGFVRKPCDGFCAFLRGLPLKPGKPSVRLYNGALKSNQTAHVAVVDIDVGKTDLQQCADAVLRLWAEYLYAQNAENDICIPLTNGEPFEWSRFRRGERPSIRKNRLHWATTSAAANDSVAFHQYLTFAFTYAGTASLKASMVTNARLADIRVGDVFVKAGFPGHAVLVVDVVENHSGQKAFLLAQSYMPAQDIHILKNPNDSSSPWYSLNALDALETPEWTFAPGSLFRFRERPCR